MLNIVAHGTFIGNIRLESEKPTQLPVESVIHLASTRTYTLREKPTLPSSMQVTLQGNNEQSVDKEDNEDNEGSSGGFLGLPESDTDLKVRHVQGLMTAFLYLIFVIFEKSSPKGFMADVLFCTF